MSMVVKGVAALGLMAMVGGCAATHTAISKSDLDVQSKMTDTIFLDPVPPSRQTVYLQVKNTSDKPDFNIDPDLRGAIAAKGFTVTNNMDQAHYILQVNVLQVGKMDPSAAERMFAGGYGSALGTSAAGATIGALAGGSWMAAGIGGLAGMAVATVADAAVKDVTYSVITDVQISERSRAVVQEQTRQYLKQGRGGTRNVLADETSNWKRYQTRILSTANRVNLSYETAAPSLKAGLVQSISGIL